MAVSKKVNHGKKRPQRSIHQINEVKAKRRARRLALAGRILLHVLFGIIFLCGAVALSVAGWYKNTFDISFSDLLYTMLSP